LNRKGKDMLRVEIPKPKLSKESIRDLCQEWRSGYFDRSELVLEFSACRWDFKHFMDTAKKNGWWQDSMWQLCNLPN
jgi:hypothetical protein